MKVDGNRFRAKRFELFMRHVDMLYAHKPVVRVLDIGGSTTYWMALRDLWDECRLDITIANIDVEESDVGVFHVRSEDACRLSFPSGTFDIVHSNSVIEHVGNGHMMREMASEIRRVAPHYYLQTPNFWFPVEPHFRTPFFHWLPVSLRARILNGRKLGFRVAQTYEEALASVKSINLLTARELQELFPEGKVSREWVGPFVKSLIVTA